VGQFNDSIAEYTSQFLAPLPGRKRIWAVGERVHDRLAELGLAIERTFTVPLSIQGVTPLTGEIMLSVLARDLRGNQAPVGERGGGRDASAPSQLYLFHNTARSGPTHAPIHQRLLPLDEAWRRELSRLPWPAKNLPEVIGRNMGTLRALLREYLFVSLFRACAESLASENASRLAAMERAEKNIDELSASLQQAFNRLRQSRIDEELFDVVAGVEAMRRKVK
jgi:F-type H+-transporting ATPase subunit gamma